jgi:ABC-2 type transport system permease protein
VLAFARLEIVRTLRNYKFLLFLVALPPVLYLAYTSTGNDNQYGIPLYELAMAGLGVYAAMGSAMYATGPELAAERAGGWIRQLMVTPLSFQAWMSAKIIQGLLLVLPTTAVVAVTAALAHNVRLPASHWVWLFVAVFFGAIPFCLLGQVIGQVFNNQAASAGQLFILIGLSFLGGVFLPFEALPSGVRWFGKFTPTYDLIEILKSLIIGDRPGWIRPAGLVGWTIGLAVLVSVLWRRDSATG